MNTVYDVSTVIGSPTVYPWVRKKDGYKVPNETIYQAQARHRKELIEETLTYGHDYDGDETDR